MAVMGGDGLGDDRAEIARMRAGVRAWVTRAAGGRSLRDISPQALLSLLCASAFSPLIAVGAGVSGAAAAAGITVLSSVGGGVLSGVIASAIDRGRSKGERHEVESADLGGEIAEGIELVLAAGDASAEALRAEIAVVLEKIGAGDAVLLAAIETGNEQFRSDLVAGIGKLGAGFAEMGFLIREIAHAAAKIQRSLDEQGAYARVAIEQNDRQAADIRLVREDLAAFIRRVPGEIQGKAGAEPGPRWAHGSPYRGLLPFREADTDVFYGREVMTTELAVQVAAQLARNGPLIVTGASGAGKSSLLRAGLLPALARGMQVEGTGSWPCRVITPTSDPVTELATCLAVLSGSDTVSIRDSLARHPDQAHLEVRRAVIAHAARHGRGQPESYDDDTRLILIVDQFEQVFTLAAGSAGEEGRQAFITALCAAAGSPAGPGQKPAALVVIAVRGDFCDRCAAYPELATALHEAQFVVRPMTPPDLRRTITGPAHDAGLDIDPGLADTILSDALAVAGHDTAGALPLLSQALLLTWDKRESNRLTSHGYGQTGGVSHAVQTSADDVYDALSPGQQAVARDLLRAMTVASRDGRLTRRPVTRAGLYSGRPGAERRDIDAVLEAFASQRLLILDDGIAQIAHDALLSAWPRLRGWLEDDQANWILYSQLADAAAAWADRSNDPSFLYRGTQLAALRQVAGTWAASPARYPALAATQRDFLEASERAAVRGSRLRRVIGTALVVLLIASVAGAGIAIAAARSANRQRNLALSGQLAGESQELANTEPGIEALLAAAAWQTAPTGQARASMLTAFAEPERAVLEAPSESASDESVAFSPDGDILASADENGLARLWDVATHRQLGPPIKADATEIDDVAFSPGGGILATAGIDGAVRLWDVATHRQLGSTIRAGRLRAGAADVVWVAFSPNGKLLATADSLGAATVWTVATHRQVGAPIVSPGGVTGVAFSPAGDLLATGGNEAARLWSVATHRQVGVTMHAGRIGGTAQVVFSPDGELLATAGGSTAQLWDVATQRRIGTPITAAGGAPVNGAAFSPDGKILATVGNDTTARLWNVATHQQTGTAIDVNAGDANGVAFSPDGTVIATADDDGTARLWNVSICREIGTTVHVADFGTGAYGAAFSPNGKIFATADGSDLARLWDVGTHQQVGNAMDADAPGQDLGVNGVVFSPNGKILATAGGDGTARLWDVATQQQIGPAIKADSGNTDGVNSVAFSPNGRILATADADGTARLWDVTTHQQIGKVMPVAGEVESATFSPDGKILATADADGTARLWDVATQRQIGRPVKATSATTGVNDVVFSPDGQTFATADNDGTVGLWDVRTHHQLGPYITAGSAKSLLAIAFSPDGSIVATAGDDGTAQLWDVASHEQIGPDLAGGAVSLFNRDSLVTSLAFNPAGTILVTTDQDGAAQLWDTAFPRKLEHAMCSIAGSQQLTRQEWDIYAGSEPSPRICPQQSATIAGRPAP